MAEKNFFWPKSRFICTFISSLETWKPQSTLSIIVNYAIFTYPKMNKVDTNQELLCNQYLPTTITKQNWNFLSLLTSPYLRIQWLAHTTCTWLSVSLVWESIQYLVLMGNSRNTAYKKFIKHTVYAESPLDIKLNKIVAKYTIDC